MPSKSHPHEHALEYLKMIQETINGYTKNALTLRGSLFAILSVMFISTDGDPKPFYLFAALGLVAGFWLLDGYYNKKRRLFEKLYEIARKEQFDDGLFIMRVNELDELPSGFVNWLERWSKYSSFRSPAAFLFYLPTAAFVVLAIIYEVFFGDRCPCPTCAIPCPK